MNRSIFFLLLIPFLGFSQDTLNFDSSFLMGKKEGLVSTNLGLLPQVEMAFLEMQKAARKDSIELKIVSSFRSYAAQKRIWNRKYLRFTNEGLSPEKAITKIIEYSTIPGTSRHHWGTEIDVVDARPLVEGDVLLEEHFHDSGPYVKLGRWLTENAATYGFELVYTKDRSRKGFFYEPWHYSYSALSVGFLSTYLKENLIDQIAIDSSLLGNSYLSKPFMDRYLEEHIKGISTQLKD